MSKLKTAGIAVLFMAALAAVVLCIKKNRDEEGF